MCIPMFMAVLFTIANIWKQPKFHLIDEEDDTHTHTQWNITQKFKKIEILPFATWMNLERIIISEVSQTEKDKYLMISLICIM